MYYYELATLDIQMGKAADVAAGVEKFVAEALTGRLLGVWFSDIGALNPRACALCPSGKSVLCTRMVGARERGFLPRLPILA